MEGTSGYYVWRTVSRDGVADLCGRRKRHTASGNEADELRLLQASRDGFSWREVGVVQVEYGGRRRSRSRRTARCSRSSATAPLSCPPACAGPERRTAHGARERPGPQHRRPAARRLGRQRSSRRQEAHRTGVRRDGALLADGRSAAGSGRAPQRRGQLVPRVRRAVPDQRSVVLPTPAQSTSTPAHPAPSSGLCVPSASCIVGREEHPHGTRLA